jgi:hypothetical protein
MAPSDAKAGPMPPVAATQLEPPKSAPCRTCGQALPAGKSVCAACGAAQGEGNVCPHCNAVADVEPNATLGFRCLVCGGPRIALNVASVALGSRTRTALTAAASEQAKHLMYSAAGFLLAGMGALAVLIASAVVLTASPEPWATVAAYLAAGAPLAAGLWALARARTARLLRGEGLRTAQISALADVQATTGPLTAAQVAEALRIGPERAELLLAELSVAALLDEGPPPRLRVDAPAVTQLSDPTTQWSDPTTEQQSLPARTARGDTES